MVTLNPERDVPLPQVSLSRRVLSAGGWMIILYGFNSVLRLGSNLLMTRMLMPEMFGVISVANVVLVGLAMFSDLGLKQCVVRSERGHDPDFLNTAWAIQIIQGALLWLAALAVSLLIWAGDMIGAIPRDSAYADPVLPSVIAVLSSGVLITSFASTKYYEASRKLQVGRTAFTLMISQVVALVTMFAWVSVDRSVWALVAGGLVSIVAQVILTHVWLSGSVNRWHWDGRAAREIVRFGRWIFVSSILGFLVNNGDRLLLGGLLDSSFLGIYSIAFLLFSAVEQVPVTTINEISFPALSEVARERRQALKASYYRLQLVVASLSYGAAGFLMVAGQTIVASLYDQRYHAAGQMLEILAVGLLATGWRSGALCFMAVGRPQVLSYISAVRLVVLVLAVFLGFHFLGVNGALWGVVLAQLATIPVIAGYMVREGLLSVRNELWLFLMVPAGLFIGKLAVWMVEAASSDDALNGLARTLNYAIHWRIHSLLP